MSVTGHLLFLSLWHMASLLRRTEGILLASCIQNLCTAFTIDDLNVSLPYPAQSSSSKGLIRDQNPYIAMFGIISKVLMRTSATDDFNGTHILSLYPAPKMTIRALILYWYSYNYNWPYERGRFCMCKCWRRRWASVTVVNIPLSIYTLVPGRPLLTWWKSLL